MWSTCRQPRKVLIGDEADYSDVIEVNWIEHILLFENKEIWNKFLKRRTLSLWCNWLCNALDWIIRYTQNPFCLYSVTMFVLIFVLFKVWQDIHKNSLKISSRDNLWEIMLSNFLNKHCSGPNLTISLSTSFLFERIHYIEQNMKVFYLYLYSR